MNGLSKLRLVRSPEDEAASWFATLNKADVSAETKSDFRVWLQADARHQHAYDQLLETDAFIMGQGDALLESQLFAELEAEAALMDSAEQATAGGVSAAVVNRPWFVRTAIAASLLIAVVGASVFMMTDDLPPVMTYETERGGHRQVALADGSRVFLNTDTKVSLQFDADLREVHLLRGEAIFEVAKDADRPFVVHAGQSDVTVLGTKFVVRRFEARDDIYVLEGKVNVDAKDSPVAANQSLILVPGKQAKATAHQLSLSQPMDPQLDLSWKDGWLRYQNRPLGEVVTDLNRYLKNRLILDDEQTASLLVTAQIPLASDEDIIKAIQVAFNLQAVDTAQGVVKLAAKSL